MRTLPAASSKYLGFYNRPFVWLFNRWSFCCQLVINTTNKIELKKRFSLPEPNRSKRWLPFLLTLTKMWKQSSLRKLWGNEWLLSLYFARIVTVTTDLTLIAWDTRIKLSKNVKDYLYSLKKNSLGKTSTQADDDPILWKYGSVKSWKTLIRLCKNALRKQGWVMPDV